MRTKQESQRASVGVLMMFLKCEKAVPYVKASDKDVK